MLRRSKWCVWLRVLWMLLTRKMRHGGHRALAHRAGSPAEVWWRGRGYGRVGALLVDRCLAGVRRMLGRLVRLAMAAWSRRGGQGLALERPVALTRYRADRTLLRLVWEGIMRARCGLRACSHGCHALALRWTRCDAATGRGRRMQRGLLLRRMTILRGRGGLRICGCTLSLILALTRSLVLVVDEAPKIHLCPVCSVLGSPATSVCSTCALSRRCRASAPPQPRCSCLSRPLLLLLSWHASLRFDRQWPPPCLAQPGSTLCTGNCAP